MPFNPMYASGVMSHTKEKAAAMVGTGYSLPGLVSRRWRHIAMQATLLAL